MLDFSKIKFEDEFINGANELYDIYFIAPKDILPKEYPDAEFATIWLEVSPWDTSYKNAVARVSPTKFSEKYNGYLDYDWTDIFLSEEELNALLKIRED